MASTTRCFLATLALCVCLAHYAQGATFTLPAQQNPAHPGKCYFSSLKKAVPVGSYITDPRDCTRMRCSRSNSRPAEYTFSGETCSYATSLPANCRLVDGDRSAEFPNCCSQVKCEGKPRGTVTRVG